MATYERLDYGSVDGCLIGGAATDKVGFYGTTPVVQPDATALTALATTVFSEAKTGIWGFGSSTAAKLFRTRINQLIADVQSLRLTGILD